MNNYIQIKDFGGADRGLKFNMLALNYYFEHINLEAPNSIVYACCYAGVAANCDVKGEERNFTYEDVCDWVDKLYEQGRQVEVDNACKMWSEVHCYKEKLAQFQPEIRASLEPETIDKKKVRQRKSSIGSRSKNSPSDS